MQDRHIGDVRVTRIEEQMGPGFPAKDFFPEFDADTFAAEQHWLAPNYYQPESGRVIASIHSWLVRTGKYTVLIDSCSGNHKSRPGMPRFDMLNTKYLDRLREAGVQPEEIDFVMCTHLHVDHVGWNTKLENGRWVPTFPKARYVFADRELEFWTKRNKDDPAACPWVTDSVLPIVAANRVDLVKSQYAFNDLVDLIPTPGHTIDHYSVHVGKSGADCVITGDMIHSPIQARYPEFGMMSDYDTAQAGRSRHELFGRFCDTSTLMCTAHFPSPSTGRFVRWKDAFDFKPT